MSAISNTHSNTPTSDTGSNDGNSALPIKASASLSYNNFTTNGSWGCYVHLSEVHMISESSLSGKKQANMKQLQSKDQSQINQVKWCKLLGKSFLVLALKNGMQIFDSEGAKQLFSFQLPATNSAAGITSYETKDSAFILVGSSTGEVLFFNAKKDFLHSHVLRKDHSPICDLSNDASTVGMWVSSDQSGEVVVWKELAQQNVIPGYGHPCTSVVIRGDMVIGAYSSGHIRLFNLLSNSKMVEICAHSQCITALCLHPLKEVFASVGEDSVLSVWTILNEKTREIQCSYSTTVPNALFTGVQFCGDKWSSLAATIYDHNVLSIHTPF